MPGDVADKSDGEASEKSDEEESDSDGKDLPPILKL